jgi:lipopolysaccharide export system protein LptA
MKTSPRILLAPLLLLVLACGAHAAPPAPAPEEPDTQILSDSLQYDDINKTSTFTGNVVLTRGTMSLRADKLVTREDSQGNQQGTATAGAGHLVTVRQENPAKFETLVATGQRAEYDGASGNITLTGQATVTRLICGEAFDNVRGARIVYHQKTGTYEAFGGQNSAAADGRVRSLAQPQSRIDKAIAKCRAGRS